MPTSTLLLLRKIGRTMNMKELMQRYDNASTPTDVLDPHTRAGVNLFGGWFELVLCALVVSNSALPVIAVARYPHIRRHNMYVFLAGMAVSDIVVGAMTLCSTCLHLLSVPVLPAFCVFLGYSRLAATTASMLGLLALTADRCIAVLQPLRHRIYMSARRVRRLAPLCWLAGAVQGALLASAFARPERLPRLGVCDLFSAIQPMALVVTALGTDIIILIIVGLNLAVICTALHHSRRLLADRRHPAKKHRRKSRLVHLHSYAAVLKLLLLFLVLVVPFQIALHVYLFVPDHGSALWFVVTGLMRQCYHIFNGWVFGLWCAELRRVYMHLVCCRPLSSSSASLTLLTFRRSGDTPSKGSGVSVKQVETRLMMRHSVDHGVMHFQSLPRQRHHHRRNVSM